MAIRALHTRTDEKVSLIPRGKAVPRMDVKPRTALGTIGINSARDKHAPAGKAGGVKKAFAVPAKITRVKTSTFTARPPSQLASVSSTALPPHNRQPTPAHKPQPPPSHSQDDEFPEPEVMDMEVGQITSALSHKLMIEDIDETDRDNPQLCAEYVKEIYSYMRELEGKYQVEAGYLSRQSKVNSKMRAILIDWLVLVHLRFSLLQETLYLTVSIIDRYLQLEQCDKSELQLVGVTAMLIASKYEEMYAPQVDDFVLITDQTYSSERIRSMERQMLKVLDYSFGNPLCLHFLRRYSRAGSAGPEMHTMAKFLLELSLTDYHSLRFLPSQLAATALYIACKICSDGVVNNGEWTPTLHHYSSYSESQLLPCARRLAWLVSNMAGSKQQAVRNKYSSSRFLKVATNSGLQSRLIRELAAADSTS
jgi:cyclin B